MGMLVVYVGRVRVAVLQRTMRVRVGVGLHPVPLEFMHVLVMAVVPVRMGMGHGQVLVFMLVFFGEVQPHTDGHQRRSEPEGRARGLSKHGNRDGGPHKRSG